MIILSIWVLAILVTVAVRMARPWWAYMTDPAVRDWSRYFKAYPHHYYNSATIYTMVGRPDLTKDLQEAAESPWFLDQR